MFLSFTYACVGVCVWGGGQMSVCVCMYVGECTLCVYCSVCVCVSVFVSVSLYVCVCECLCMCMSECE